MQKKKKKEISFSHFWNTWRNSSEVAQPTWLPHKFSPYDLYTLTWEHLPLQQTSCSTQQLFGSQFLALAHIQTTTHTCLPKRFLNLHMFHTHARTLKDSLALSWDPWVGQAVAVNLLNKLNYVTVSPYFFFLCFWVLGLVVFLPSSWPFFGSSNRITYATSLMTKLETISPGHHGAAVSL